MSGKVYNQFKILLAQKEIKESRRIPYDEIKKITGMAMSTISAWSTNNIKRYDADTIASLCEYFGCDVGKLIVYESGNSGSD
jgi:putative transcriptional regulator